MRSVSPGVRQPGYVGWKRKSPHGGGLWRCLQGFSLPKAWSFPDSSFGLAARRAGGYVFRHGAAPESLCPTRGSGVAAGWPLLVVEPASVRAVMARIVTDDELLCNAGCLSVAVVPVPRTTGRMKLRLSAPKYQPTAHQPAADSSHGDGECSGRRSSCVSCTILMPRSTETSPASSPSTLLAIALA